MRNPIEITLMKTITFLTSNAYGSKIRIAAEKLIWLTLVKIKQIFFYKITEIF